MDTYHRQIKGKTILITGGTGSFGNAVTDQLLKYDPERIVIFSRDEKKQFDMGNRLKTNKVRFITGDVRDKDSVSHAMYGVDYVFHAAALKQVPNCEFFPLEAIRTNALSAHNVIDAAIDNEVERVVVLSTDKAVYPINVMGMTKALMEKIMIAAAREKRNHTVLCGTRYGNVMYTRASVIPYFIELMKAGQPIQVTNGKMTRFMMSLQQSIDLVLFALTNGENGDIYVRKAPAATIEDLVAAMTSLFKYDKKTIEIGTRPGEKLHETLISSEESHRAEDRGDYYRIKAEVPDMDIQTYFFKGEPGGLLPEVGYTSANTKQLNVEELTTLLLSLTEVQNEVATFGKK